jgi:hypothetical protein
VRQGAGELSGGQCKRGGIAGELTGDNGGRRMNVGAGAVAFQARWRLGHDGGVGMAVAQAWRQSGHDGGAGMMAARANSPAEGVVAARASSLMSMHVSVLVDSVGPPSAEVCRAATSFP